MIGAAIEVLAASALLMALVLVLRAPVRRAFGPAVAYGLWALPALRLALPPLPPAWHASVAAPVAAVGERITVLIVTAPAAPAAAASSFPVAAVLVSVWAAVACALFGWHVLAHRRFCRRLLDGAVATRMLAGGSVRLVESAACAGPLAFGLWRPTVVVPSDFADRYDAEERALALAHELGHHLRGDLFANWIALAVLALHWFDPLAWMSFRAFRADQEMANDAAVLARRPALRHAYGRAIAKAARGAAFSAACHLHTVDDLKGRLKMLARSPASPHRLWAGTALTATVVCAGLGLTASGTPAVAALGARVGDAVAALPRVPAPPAPPTIDPPAPPAPSAPPAAGRGRKHVVIVTDGKTTTYDGPAADAYLAAHSMPAPPVPPVPPAPPVAGAPPVPPAPPIPPVAVSVRYVDGMPVVETRRVTSMSSRDKDGRITSYAAEGPDVERARCAGPDDARPMIENSTTDGRQRIVICMNRVAFEAKSALQAGAGAEATARQARASARINLGIARGAIERDRNLSDDQRRQALAGIAQAEKELAGSGS